MHQKSRGLLYNLALIFAMSSLVVFLRESRWVMECQNNGRFPGAYGVKGWKAKCKFRTGEEVDNQVDLRMLTQTPAGVLIGMLKDVRLP